MRQDEARISLGLLGSMALERDDGTSIRSVLSQPKRVAILTYLACAGPGDFVRRDKLLALFWPESDDSRGRGALRQTLYYLRRSLGDGVLVTRGDDEVGVDVGLLRCDAIAFEAAVQRGEPREAIELYRGDFLDGFHLPDHKEVEWWVEDTRNRLRGLALAAAEQVAEEARSRGDLAKAVAMARRGTELAPTNARTVLLLVELLAEGADVAGALQAYRSFEERLAEELGLEPPAELRDAVQRIQEESRGGASEDAAGPVPSLARGSSSPDSSPPISPARSAESAPSSSHGPPSSAEGARRRWSRPLLAAAAIALVFSLGYQWRAEADAVFPVAPGKDRVLVSIFQDRWLRVFPSREARDLAAELSEALVRSERFAPLARKATANVDPRSARNQFRADYVVSGSVQRDGDVREVSMQLIDTRSELVVWAERYDVPAEAGRDWREEFSRSVVQSIAQSTNAESPTMETSQGSMGTSDQDAYYAYWDGRALWHQRQPRLMLEALQSYRRAIDLDRDFAAPYAAIADIYNLLGSYDYGVQRPSEAFPVALASARSAIERDPGLGEAWAALGFAMGSYEWDFEESQRYFERALAERPDYAAGHHWYSLTLLVEGRDSAALAHIERARELDPTSAVIRTAVGRHHYYRRDFETAIANYDQALRVDPDFPPAHVGLGLTYALLGRMDEAEEAYRTAATIVGVDAPLIQAMQGHLLGLRGDQSAAFEIRRELERSRRWLPPEYQALVELGIGDLDRAVSFLESAFEERSGAMLFLEIDPMLDPLHGHPGFERLIDRVRRYPEDN